MTWRTKQLRDLADLCLGKMLDKEKNKGELRPYLANLNVRWGTFDLSDLREMRFEDREIERYGIRTGDIVMCEGGEPGRCAIWRDQRPGMMLQKAIHRIRSRLEVDHRFLFYSLVHKGQTRALDQYFTGSTIKHLPSEKLALVEVEYPALEAQRRIASILSAYDDLIENNARRIAILEEMARRLYEEWFVRFRFPGHEGVRMVESEMGLVPQGWEVTTLGQLAEVNARSVRRGAEPTEIQYVDISSVSTGSIDKKERLLFADAPGRARRIVRDGDVIWACVRPNRKSYSLVLNPEPNLLVSTGFAVLSPVAVPCSFLYQCVTTKDFVSHLVNHAKGATYPAVSAADFDNAKVLKPSDNLVADFDELAEPMMRLVAALHLKNQNLRTTRDLLLPKLISGELDVSTLAEPQAQTT